MLYKSSKCYYGNKVAFSLRDHKTVCVIALGGSFICVCSNREIHSLSHMLSSRFILEQRDEKLPICLGINSVNPAERRSMIGIYMEPF